MMNDIIADALTRIRNAALRKLEVATLLHSNTVVGILNVLEKKEYIEGFKVVDGENNKKTVQVTLKYDDNDNSVINEIKRVSTPGRRVYKNAQEIKSFKILIIRTEPSIRLRRKEGTEIPPKFCLNI